MKKRIVSLTLALALCAGLITPALGAEEYRHSGSASVDKLSKEEIAQLLSDNPLTLPDDVFDVTPSCTVPYAAGAVKTAALQAAADRLSALRRIAGLPAVQLDQSLCEQAQYGAVIQASQGGLNHYPAQPAGMDDGFYQQAQDASSSSNLSAGRTLTGAVDGFMDDSDASNIDRVGHRRWQLNPALGKVGFGYAESNTMYGRYVAEKVFDRSGSCTDYDFIAWPASGNFPSTLFDGDVAWSVSLNPSQYGTPRQSDLTVTLTRESDGRTWTFRGSSYTASSSGAYFNVDTGGYGISNCIVFRPDGVDSYEGVYTVEIDGLTTRSGGAVGDFAYQVEFFDPEHIGEEPSAQTEEPSQPVQPDGSGAAAFADVPASHWAYDAIRKMAEEGVMTGVGDGRFNPGGTVTNGEFFTMLVRAFYPQTLSTYQSMYGGGAWWLPASEAAEDVGLLLDTKYGATHALYPYDWMSDRAIDRENMAQAIGNLLSNAGYTMSEDAQTAAQAGFKDWSDISSWNQKAVAMVYVLGLMTGTDQGTFAPKDSVTRAEAAVILARLLDFGLALEAGGV